MSLRPHTVILLVSLFVSIIASSGVTSSLGIVLMTVSGKNGLPHLHRCFEACSWSSSPRDVEETGAWDSETGPLAAAGLAPEPLHRGGRVGHEMARVELMA